MLLFDYSIRPEGTPPPFKNTVIFFGRISDHLLLCLGFFLFGQFYLFPKWQYLGFVLYIVTYNVILGTEGLKTNAFGRNIQNLRKAGYSDIHVWLLMEFNLIGSQFFELACLLSTVFCILLNKLQQFLGYYINQHLISNQNVISFAYLWQNLSYSVIFKIGCNIVISEILFYHGHRLMHTSTSLMKFHVLHHCVTFPTYASNLIFHPIDLAIEFMGPFFGLITSYYILWKNEQQEVIFFISYLIFQMSYGVNHDEFMGTFHIAHHGNNDSNYSAYGCRKSDPTQNILNKYMRSRDMDLCWPSSLYPEKQPHILKKNTKHN